MNTVSKTDQIPVTDSYDIVVVGGGPAGLAAAISAARSGMKTLVIEQFNCLGGVATAGGHGHVCLYSSWSTDTRVVGGVIYEMAQRVKEAGYGVHNNSQFDFEVEGLKLILEQMAEECGLHILYHTFFSDVIMEGNTVTGVITQSKNGRQAFAAKRVIDCTGDGDVCFKANCGFDYGDEDSGFCQPVTLMFTIGGVDWGKVSEFRQGDYKLENVWQQAQENGDMRPFQHCIMGWWWTPTRPDQVGVNFTHVNYVDCRKAEDLTAATIEGRKQAYETIEVYRKYIPGMEECYMISTPNTIGLRESRRIHTLHTLTKEEVLAQSTFDDSIGYGSFFIDIHNCSGPGMDKKEKRPDPGFKYQIPYRILVPREAENLLVAGRCAGADHEALGSLRVMPQCGLMGEAAAYASILSLQNKSSVKDIDISALQEMIRTNGGIVNDADIERINS